MLPVIWDRRTRLVLIISQWVALALGIFASFTVAAGPHPLALSAAGVAGLYVLGSTSAPIKWFRRPLVLDATVVVGVILTMVAVTLTGGAESPYLLLSITPTLWAGVFGGARPAFSAALLASGLLLLVEMGLSSPNWPGIILVTGLQLIIAITISQVRRLLGDMQARAAQMELSQAESLRRLAELEDAHDLLTRLSELTAGQETNPMKLGTAALENLVRRFPGTAGAVAIASPRGPVLVARVGVEPPGATRITIPLEVSDGETGWVMLATPQGLSKSEVDGIKDSLHPLALAFSNVLIIQEIAGKAISEERSRIARELHDDLGPSLASLGLSLDLAMVQHSLDQPLAEQLTQLRRSVSYLVDDIRKTVADLRAEAESSLTNAIRQTIGRLQPGPELVIELDERRPPRPAVAQELASITGEAIRNAFRHSGARTVMVNGVVDHDRGWVSIIDDGNGFAPDSVEDGHYGLVGMKERAHKIGGRLDILSEPGGTNVTVEWGSQ
jgi:signal transduction histidine kinase